MHGYKETTINIYITLKFLYILKVVSLINCKMEKEYFANILIEKNVIRSSYLCYIGHVVYAEGPAGRASEAGRTVRIVS